MPRGIKKIVPEPIDLTDVPYWSANSNSKFIPVRTRKKWKELVPELVGVVCEAARRKALRENPGADMYDKPLSAQYIKDRIKWDEPLRGYIVRTNDKRKAMQGFIIYTDFNVWQWSFRWDSTSPQSGIRAYDSTTQRCDDGTLTAKLAAAEQRRKTPRKTMISKEPVRVNGRWHTSPYCGVIEGFTWPSISEVSLLGGLGCGEALCRKAIEDITKNMRRRFIVLQATKLAVPFYERIGFTRVGAVFRVGDRAVMPEIPYRHFTFSTRWDRCSFSYMMAIDLEEASPVTTPIAARSRSRDRVPKKRSFDSMRKRKNDAQYSTSAQNGSTRSETEPKRARLGKAETNETSKRRLSSDTERARVKVEASAAPSRSSSSSSSVSPSLSKQRTTAPPTTTTTTTTTRLRHCHRKGIKCPACAARSEMLRKRREAIAAGCIPLESTPIVTKTRPRRAATIQSRPRRSMSQRRKRTSDVDRRRSQSSSHKRSPRTKKTSVRVVLTDAVQEREAERARSLILKATRVQRGRHCPFAIKELIMLATRIVQTLRGERYESMTSALTLALDVFCNRNKGRRYVGGDATARTRAMLLRILGPDVIRSEEKRRARARGRRNRLRSTLVRVSANESWIGRQSLLTAPALVSSVFFKKIVIPKRRHRVRFMLNGELVLKASMYGKQAVVETKMSEALCDGTVPRATINRRHIPAKTPQSAPPTEADLSDEPIF